MKSHELLKIINSLTAHYLELYRLENQVADVRHVAPEFTDEDSEEFDLMIESIRAENKLVRKFTDLHWYLQELYRFIQSHEKFSGRKGITTIQLSDVKNEKWEQYYKTKSKPYTVIYGALTRLVKLGYLGSTRVEGQSVFYYYILKELEQ